jgi:hypothetical protein
VTNKDLIIYPLVLDDGGLVELLFCDFLNVCTGYDAGQLWALFVI